MRPVTRFAAWAAVCALLCAFLSPARAQSEAVSHTIPELGLTLSLPPELVVLSRDMAADDPSPALFGLTGEQVDRHFVLHDIYFNAVDAQVTYEILVTMSRDHGIEGPEGIDGLSEDARHALVDRPVAAYGVDDIARPEMDMYTGNSETAFVRSRLDLTAGEKTAWGVEYTALVDGMDIRLALLSYDAPVTPRRLSLMEGAVAAAVFEDLSHPAVDTGDAPVAGPPPAAAPLRDIFSWRADPAGLRPVPLAALYLAAWFFVLALPVAVYRLAIRKKPLSKRSSARVTLLCGLGAALAAAVYIALAGSLYAAPGVLLWSVFNYLILSSGSGAQPPAAVCPPVVSTSDSVEAAAADDERQPPPPHSNSTVCGSCSAVNLAGARRCFFCGATLEPGLDAAR